LIINYFERKPNTTTYVTVVNRILGEGYSIQVLDTNIRKKEYVIEFNKVNREVNQKIFVQRDITELIDFSLVSVPKVKTFPGFKSKPKTRTKAHQTAIHPSKPQTGPDRPIQGPQNRTPGLGATTRHTQVRQYLLPKRDITVKMTTPRLTLSITPRFQ
jgi:hypothetical protein